MAKKLFYFLISCSILLAKEYEVNNLIDIYNNKGYQNKYEELELQKLESNFKELQKGNKNGTTVLFDTDYSYDSESKMESSVKVSYDIFNIKSTYDYEESQWNSSLGIEKDIKDYIYSKNSYNLSIFEKEEKIDKNELEEKKENDILSIIDVYKNYQEKLIDKNLYNQKKEYLLAEYKKLEKEYELGIENRLNYKYAKVNLDNIEKDLKNIEGDLDDLRNDLVKTFNIKLNPDDTLLPFNSKLLEKEINFDNIGTRDLENLEYQKANAKEKKKYEDYVDKSPEMTLGADYFIDEENWNINFTLSKTFGDYNSALIENEIDIKKYTIEIEETKEKYSLEKENLKKEYEALKTDIEKYKNTAKIKEMEYLIKKEKYKQGTGDYIDYIEVYNQYYESKGSYLKKENELKALILKILNRR